MASGDANALRKLSEAANTARQVFEAWALAQGGSVVDQGTIEIPATALAELDATRQQYALAANSPASVGVGPQVGQALTALTVAQKRGGNQIVPYDEKVAAEASAEPMAKNIVVDPAPSPPVIDPTPTAPTVDPTPTIPSQPPFDRAAAVQELHAAALAGEKEDRLKDAATSGELAALRQRTATALDELRQQLPALQQLKTAYPQAYAAVIGTVQQLIEVGRQLQTLDPGTDLGS